MKSCLKSNNKILVQNIGGNNLSYLRSNRLSLFAFVVMLQSEGFIIVPRLNTWLTSLTVAITTGH